MGKGRRVWWWEVLQATTYVEIRRVSFIYYIVDKIIVLLSELFIDGSLYKNNCG